MKLRGTSLFLASFQAFRTHLFIFFGPGLHMNQKGARRFCLSLGGLPKTRQACLMACGRVLRWQRVGGRADPAAGF